MSIDRQLAERYLGAGDLASLFTRVLGWDYARGHSNVTVSVGTSAYLCEPVAAKSGVVVYVCSGCPPLADRARVSKLLRQYSLEHLVVFAENRVFLFDWYEARATGGRRRVVSSYDPERRTNSPLLERLEALAFPFGDGPPPVLDVVARLRGAFDVERVTDRFYKAYRKQHAALQAQIAGIPDEDDRRWYASLLLNRLMFAYFLQKKGFLDGDRNYLRTRYERLQERGAPVAYHTFYRAFLQRLFLEGFGERPQTRLPDLDGLIGDIPYINGGLFLRHSIEQRHEDIDVPDEVFGGVFRMFDQFQWHLDDRPLANADTINPDILGYIFEQYINQKAQGAYYTKEDVTGYMVNATVVPWLVDQVESQVGRREVLWQLLREDPLRYLPPELTHGLNAEVVRPEDPLARADSCGDDVRLPAESWSEAWDRHRRVNGLIEALRAGELATTDAAVTHNVNLLRLTLDAILSEDEEPVLTVWWEALRRCSLLDPTCGSGAFLFAGLQVLEQVADVIVSGLERIADDEHPVLREAAAHSSRRYWLRKTIVLTNLYGADLMQEATEVAKLRLFLALLAHIDRRADLEPLPDLDFNLRSGNAVVGYASVAEALRDLAAHRSRDRSLFDDNEDEVGEDVITTAMRGVATSYSAFVSGQRKDADPAEHRVRKAELNERAAELRAVLDEALASSRCAVPRERAGWLASTTPLHWVAEFPQVMLNGGFAVLAGNPPYLSLGPYRDGSRPLLAKDETGKTVKDGRGKAVELYRVEGFETARCPDLYAMVMERASQLTASSGRYAMVVMLSAACGGDFATLRTHLDGVFPRRWISTYSNRPSRLFPGVEVRNTIFVGARGGDPELRTTRCHRWVDASRAALFATLEYAQPGPLLSVGRWPTVGSQALANLFERLLETGHVLRQSLGSSGGLFGEQVHELGYKTAGRNWLSVFLSEPPTSDSEGHQVVSSATTSLAFPSAEVRDVAFALTAGKLAFLWWTVNSDDYNVTREVLTGLPVAPAMLTRETTDLLRAGLPDLDRAMRGSLKYQTTTVAKGGVKRTLRIGRYDLSACRNVTDRFDRAVLRDLRLEEYWDAVELAYVQAVRANPGDDSDDN